MSKIIVFLLLSFLVKKNIYAYDTTNVICANKNGNWEWLKNSANVSLTVVGKWQNYIIEHENILFSLDVFHIQHGQKIYDELKNKCNRKFGRDYFPQPASTRFSAWKLFKIENDLAIGMIEISYIIHTTPLRLISTNIFLPNQIKIYQFPIDSLKKRHGVIY